MLHARHAAPAVGTGYGGGVYDDELRLRREARRRQRQRRGGVRGRRALLCRAAGYITLS
jgi:hypothetical protein